MLRRSRTALGLAAGGLVGVLAAGATASQPAAVHARVAGFGSGGEAAPVGSSPTPPTYAVGLQMLQLRDASRSIRLRHGRRRPRTLLTYVRYPAAGATAQTDAPNAAPQRVGGPFPLVVFAHGFAVTPRIYARLLQSWTRAGYVVAAPVFPLENANAPGGPDEADLINQPQDMRFVISSLLTASAGGTGPLAGLIDPTRIAVAGQSDGGETALAAAYSERFRDPRIGAAVILSGAEMAGVGGFPFAPGSAPLLATQGTADRVNRPRYTNVFFRAAQRPKYLLRLLGAEHLPPYTQEQPQLSIVERVTIAFLDGYLKQSAGAQQSLAPLGSVPERAAMIAAP